MKRILNILDRFFFEKISANGFGLMRIAWAAVVLVFMLGFHTNVVSYYSDAGIIPPEVGDLVFRSAYRFTILDTITVPSAVIMLYWSFMACLFCMMLGILPRLTTIVSVLLLFSFHERNLQILAGGDTLLRDLGFVLMIAPGISAFSLDRLLLQKQHWKKTGQLLPELTMSIWPYRLVLWQFLILYVTSGWNKLHGDMWTSGTALEAAFHHTHFVRYSKTIQDILATTSTLTCFYWVTYELLWVFMLIPRTLWNIFPERLRRFSFKRFLLFIGVLSHGMIFILFEVGTFSFVMFTGYLGLLVDRDFAAFKRMLNRKWSGKITVLYDGTCNLCLNSTLYLTLLDKLDRVHLVNFCNTTLHNEYAPEISSEDLSEAMHIKMPNGSVYKGFDAFRALSWNLPATKILTPLLYIPGIPPLGRAIYAMIAKRRNRTGDVSCKHG